MLRRFCDGAVPKAGPSEAIDEALRTLAESTVQAVDQAVRSLHLNSALVELWKLVRAVNKYIDDAQPWALAKEGRKERLGTVMYHLFEALRIEALLIAPFLPRTGQKMWEQLGQEGQVLEHGLQATAWGGTKEGTRVMGGDPLFPRLDVEEVLDALARENEEQEGSASQAPPETRAKEQPKTASKTTKEQAGSVDGLITIDEFSKVELRLARILEADKVQGADKLLKLQVDLGDEKRQIVAGIAQHYTPEQLVGKTIVVVANLKPAKLRGEISQGMLLAASDASGRLSLVTVDDDLPAGSIVR